MANVLHPAYVGVFWSDLIDSSTFLPIQEDPTWFKLVSSDSDFEFYSIKFSLVHGTKTIQMGQKKQKSPIWNYHDFSKPFQCVNVGSHRFKLNKKYIFGRWVRNHFLLVDQLPIRPPSDQLVPFNSYSLSNNCSTDRGGDYALTDYFCNLVF